MAAAERVLAGVRSRVRCYAQGLKENPQQTGKLVVSVRVAPDGSVSASKITSNVGISPDVASCVARSFTSA